jgi:hypothetical protein
MTHLGGKSVEDDDGWDGSVSIMCVTVTCFKFVGKITCFYYWPLARHVCHHAHAHAPCLTVYHKDTYWLSAACQVDLPIGQHTKCAVPLYRTFLISDVPAPTDPPAVSVYCLTSVRLGA